MKKGFYISIFFIFLMASQSVGQSSVTEFFELGKKALNEQDYITAIAEFTHVLSMDPENGEAYFLRAKAKDDLAEQIGFSDTELCHDLVSALNYGRIESLDLLEENCMGFCFTMKNAFYTPENVFCADLSNSVLTELPHNLDELTQLVKLNLYNNRLTELSDDIEHLGELVDLDLSSNNLKTINPKVAHLEYLHWINLNKNNLMDLPKEFSQLSHLKSLYLRNNYFKTVPLAITRLENLETLDLSLNDISYMPVEMANLKNLKELILVGNKIPSSEQKKIEALLPNTKIYFDKEN